MFSVGQNDAKGNWFLRYGEGAAALAPLDDTGMNKFRHRAIYCSSGNSKFPHQCIGARQRLGRIAFAIENAALELFKYFFGLAFHYVLKTQQIITHIPETQYSCLGNFFMLPICNFEHGLQTKFTPKRHYEITVRNKSHS
jgi:hypothetical protein